MEEYENKRFQQENYNLFKTILKRYKIRALSSPIMEVLGGIAVAVIVWYGGSAGHLWEVNARKLLFLYCSLTYAL
jgi:ABC-type multidrug transport system fused ATPase/permease subunit